MKKIITTLAVIGAMSSVSAFAAGCLPNVTSKLSDAAKFAATQKTGGYGLNMWVTYVDETGKVCSVITTGTSGANAGNTAWLGSRVISAQKANTANDFSLDGYAISTANLYSAVQPGGSLFGLQLSNPVDPTLAYSSSVAVPQYGAAKDPLIGKRIGGVNVFGGGLALYSAGKKIGAIGVSGDTSCRDHAFAWNVRSNLQLQPTSSTAGITTSNMDFNGNPQKAEGATVGDEMIINANGNTTYWAAWSQPACPNSLKFGEAANGTIILK
jgi:uncharacterized protein GlcG (DUF336 family)